MKMKDNINEFTNKKLFQKAIKDIPKDFSKEEKEYLIERMNNFKYIQGEVFWNDEFIKFSDVQKEYIVQKVADGAFRVLIKLVKSDLPQKYWDVIIQKITISLFEKTKVLITEKEENKYISEQINACIESSYTEILQNIYEKK